MYSPKVLEHIENPRNAGEIPDASTRGYAENPVCGDKLYLYLKIEDGKIIASGFKVQGCPPSISAGSVLTEIIDGLSLDEAHRLTPLDVTHALGHLPRNKEHCSTLAIDALKDALSNFNLDENLKL